MVLVCVEVVKRYVLNMPTAWIFDASNMLYGSLFMLSGAYALAQNAHVRGDFLYSSMRPRTQATFDLVLYIVFFLPGIAALALCRFPLRGAFVADRGAFLRHRERSADLSLQDGHPGGRALVMLQGLAEIVRCSVCLRTGHGRAGSRTSAEIDVVEEQLAFSEHVR